MSFQLVVPAGMVMVEREREAQRDSKLLQDTAYVRDGRSRIATPNKAAIMTLSRSFEKRRLGKQQQLLTDIALRCREQEVSDLSSGISRKVQLAEGPSAREGSLVSSSTSPRPKLQGKGGVPQKAESESGGSVGVALMGVGTPPSVSAESMAASESSSLQDRTHTMFPQRKVLRSPKKEGPTPASALSASAPSGLPRLSISYRKGVTPSDSYYHKAVVLNQQQINGQIQLHHYIQPRQDHLAPLVLPSIQYVGLDNNNVNTYIQARRLNISVSPKTGKAEIRITARR